MTTAQNKYAIGDIVYLAETAAIGRIEAIKISGVMLGTSGWLYSTNYNLGAGSPGSYFERRSLVNTAEVIYKEEDFLTLCDALRTAEAYAKLLYDKMRAQRISLCGDGTEG